jgi:asparagine synthetase A
MKLKEGKMYSVRNPDTNRWNKMKYYGYNWICGEVFVSPTSSRSISLNEEDINTEVKEFSA